MSITLYTRRLLILLVLLAISVATFLFWQSRGSWALILPFRGQKVLALTLTGTAIAVATVVFQTLTANRILTPSIMGLDALYLLLQIVAIALLGGSGYAQLDSRWQFLTDVMLMMVVAGLLFGVLMRYFNRELYRLLLIGVIFGVLCRSLTSFVARILSPEDYAVFQGAAFAQFNRIDSTLLTVAGICMAVCLAIIWHNRHVLDIVALGRNPAIGLGIHHNF